MFVINKTIIICYVIHMANASEVKIKKEGENYSNQRTLPGNK